MAQKFFDNKDLYSQQKPLFSFSQHYVMCISYMNGAQCLWMDDSSDAKSREIMSHDKSRVIW